METQKTLNSQNNLEKGKTKVEVADFLLSKGSTKLS